MEKDALSSILQLRTSVITRILHHFRERKEPICQFVFIYCIEGAGWFRCGDQEYTVTANQYFILPAGVTHAYGSMKRTPAPFTGYISREAGLLLLPSGQPSDRNKTERPVLISNRNDLFEEIFRTLEMGYSHENLLYACSAFHYYLGSLRYLQQYREAAL